MIMCNRNINELDEIAAFGDIIRSPEEMPKRVEWTPIEQVDPEWKEWLKQKWWATNYTGEIQPHLKPLLRLINLLLQFGGEEVCMPAKEPDLYKILARGQLWYGNRIDFVEGLPCECHRNVSYLWVENKAFLLIATGYALSDDGMWRQHSWAINPITKKVIETTKDRLLYFGYVLDLEESERFFYENTL